jgi:hypothetical protein
VVEGQGEFEAGAEGQMNSGVYQIRCDVTGDRYIGSSTRLRSRKSIHLSNLRDGRHDCRALQTLFNTLGQGAFTFSVLEECPAEQTFEREKHWIDTANPELNRQKRRIGGTRPRGNKVLISFSLPRDMLAELNLASASGNPNRSQVIERAVEMYLSSLHRKPKPK